mgnify:CR=1 FL=1
MPYGVSFTKRIPFTNREDYFNDCCVGDDIVGDHLLTAITSSYSSIQSNQEDWGWFIWFKKGSIGLAIDIHTDDPEEGAFRIHLTSTKKRLFLLNNTVDTPELEELRELVVAELTACAASNVQVRHLDKDYN